MGRLRFGLLVAATAVVAVGSSGAQVPMEILLWPDGMPAPAVPADPPERVEKGADGTGRRFNVSRPRLIVFRPPAEHKATGAAIIVVPGGGFGRLADEHEGSDACRWLADRGATAFLLIHRCPTDRQANPAQGPAQDLQKAVLEVRRRSASLGVDAAKVGVLGFSAGGQVTLIAATSAPFLPQSGPSHKPDFMLLLYPWRIYDPETKALRSDIRPEAGLPPTFIAQMTDDASSLPQGSTLLYLELVNRKIPAELHLYERGGHGFGMRPRPGATGPTDWAQRAADWLRLRGYLAP